MGGERLLMRLPMLRYLDWKQLPLWKRMMLRFKGTTWETYDGTD